MVLPARWCFKPGSVSEQANSMTAKRLAIRVLDRVGGRWVLAALATWYARRLTGREVVVLYDDLWIRSLDSETFVADAPTFRYSASDLLTFPDLVRRISEDVQDYWFHVYEPQCGDVIIDVGAGIGFDTLVFSRAVGMSGKVIAIEAHPKTFRKLEKICELNQLTNTTCLQLAVVDDKREVHIEDLPRHEFNTTALSPSSNHLYEVHGLSLDEICKQQEIEHIDFLKMNIEGAERLAICGMSEMLKRTKCVCIACHDFRSDEHDSEIFSTRKTVIDFLRSNSFQVVTRADDARPYVRDHIHAVREGFLGAI